jgi:hypothetical protein
MLGLTRQRQLTRLKERYSSSHALELALLLLARRRTMTVALVVGLDGVVKQAVYAICGPLHALLRDLSQEICDYT